MKTSKSYLERHNWQLRLQDAIQSGTQTEATSGASSNKINSKPASRPITFLNTLWQGFVKTIIGGNELRVWQTSDADGYVHWRAYDPSTGETAICDSEDEMRVWLEQRYHHHPEVSEQRYQKQYHQLLPLR